MKLSTTQRSLSVQAMMIATHNGSRVTGIQSRDHFHLQEATTYQPFLVSFYSKNIVREWSRSQCSPSWILSGRFWLFLITLFHIRFCSDHKYERCEEIVENELPANLVRCVFCSQKFKGKTGLEKHEKHCDAFKKLKK